MSFSSKIVRVIRFETTYFNINFFHYNRFDENSTDSSKTFIVIFRFLQKEFCFIYCVFVNTGRKSVERSFRVPGNAQQFSEDLTF